MQRRHRIRIFFKKNSKVVLTVFVCTSVTIVCIRRTASAVLKYTVRAAAERHLITIENRRVFEKTQRQHNVTVNVAFGAIR